MLVFLFLYKITVLSLKGKFINSATSRLQVQKPSQAASRPAPPKGELYRCFPSAAKSSPFGRAGKAARLWLRGFMLPRQIPICWTKPSIPHSPMKEQADIAQKAGYHRHDDTLPLVVAVRGQRSDICWTSIVLLLESVCPKPCWNRVRQIGNCKFLYYHIFKTCFAFALTNWNLSIYPINGFKEPLP